MSRPIAIVCVLLLTVLAPLALTGCESHLTQDNFDTIKVGMTRSEVEALLGGEGELQTAGGYGVDAAGLPSSSKEDTSQRVYVWKEGTVQFTISFKDDKVVTKVQSGL